MSTKKIVSFAISEEAAKKVDTMSRVFNVTKGDYVDTLIMSAPPDCTKKEMIELYKMATSTNKDKTEKHTEIKQHITKNEETITEETTITITRKRQDT